MIYLFFFRMVIKYSNIKTLKKLFSNTNSYTHWFNFLINNYSSTHHIVGFGKSSLELKFFRFFFWFSLLTKNSSKNFLLFYKKFKYCLLYFKLLMYLKVNSICYYNILFLDKKMALKKLNFLITDKSISVIFLYNSNLNNISNKVITINNIDLNMVKLYNYFLNIG